MNSTSTDMHDKFRGFLNEQGVTDTSRCLNVVDFGHNAYRNNVAIPLYR